MPSGIANFQISNLHNNVDSNDLWTGEVRFVADEIIGQYDVAHHVTVKVRITASERATVEELREAFYQKAVEQMRRAILASEGKSARELLVGAQTELQEFEASLLPS